MKKVKMILTNRFDPDIRVYKEAKYLISKGFDVEILCWDRESQYKNKETDFLDGIKIKRFFPYAKYGTGLKQLKAYFEFIIKCKEYLKDKEYEYLHCHDLDGVIAGYIIKNNKAKLIFDMHEFYEINGNKKRIKLIIRQIVRFFQNKSNKIIYVNEVQKEPMSTKNKDKLIYLPNYPEKNNYKGANKIKTDKLNISYIGVVRQYNELKNLMDACNKMANVNVNIHGTGVKYGKLKEIESNYNNVKITGIYNYNDSIKLYNNADILYAMYPNHNLQNKSSYPIKLFEAIITKTPIIVNKDTDLEKFIVKYDIGFVVDGSNIDKIKKTIQYINNNREVLDKKMNNLGKIQFEFSWGNVVSNLDYIYIN